MAKLIAWEEKVHVPSGSCGRWEHSRRAGRLSQKYNLCGTDVVRGGVEYRTFRVQLPFCLHFGVSQPTLIYSC